MSEHHAQFSYDNLPRASNLKLLYFFLKSNILSGHSWSVFHSGLVCCAVSFCGNLLLRFTQQLDCLLLRCSHQCNCTAEPALRLAGLPLEPDFDFRDRMGISGQYLCYSAGFPLLQYVENISAGYSRRNCHFPLVSSVPAGKGENP